MKRSSILIICLLLIIIGCGPIVSNTVILNRDRYVSQINPLTYDQFKGKTILLNSIADNSKNTTNLTYFNPERTFSHEMFYSKDSSWPQPLVSYLWYALQKGFESVGIRVLAEGSIYDAALSMTINSMTDEEVKFDVLMIRTKMIQFQKSYVVTMPKAPSGESEILEQRSYRMLDKMIEAMLGDPGFQEGIRG